MNEVWLTIRTVTFALLFLTFVIMVYKGVVRMVVDRAGFMWDRFLNFLWVVATIIRIAEFLFHHDGGGWYVIGTFVVSILQLYVVIWIYKEDPYNQVVQVVTNHKEDEQ